MATYSKEFKAEAIRLSDEIGNKKAAAQLGIPYYTLADWRNNSKHPKKKPKYLAKRSFESEIVSLNVKMPNCVRQTIS